MTATFAKTHTDLCGHPHTSVVVIATAPGEVVTLRLRDGEALPGTNPFHAPAADPDAEALRRIAMLRAAGFTEAVS